jgi:hypothetical protein
LERERLQLEAAKEKAMDDKVKEQLMWNVPGAEDNMEKNSDRKGGQAEGEGETGLSSGLGLALLSRALGV